MGRRSIHGMKARKEPILDHYVQASIEQGIDEAGHYGKLTYAQVEDHERAKEIRRALFRSANHLGVSLKCDLVQDPVSGNWNIPFRAIDKAVARAHIARQVNGDPAKLAYNPYGAR